jgi:hypothetical protein
VAKDVTMIASNVDPFPAADLETNRSGRLSDAQRKRLRGLARAGRKDEFLLAVVCAGLAVFLLVAPLTSPNVWFRPVAAAGLIVVALLILRAAVTGDSLTKDLRSGRVETVEGAIGKHDYDTEGSHSRYTNYYLDVAGRSFSVDGTAYHAAPEVGIVRLYVLPRSHVILNLEHLPDRPLPAGATSSPTAAIGDAITAVRSQDPVKSAEARAELAAIEKAMKAEMSGTATPPPADQRDPRPLAQAILGTWQTGPISMSFLPDGAMIATMPGGHQRQGRWSIGPDGRLHSTTTGRDEAIDAWVAGDVLTISDKGQAMSYRRAAGH